MSASLVGSEMCIRDRQHSAPTASALFLDSGRFQQRQDPRIRTKRDMAVSYTHLTLPTICSV
eukprot:11506276-Alexandrium_andersonii.AAC.1